MQTVLAEALRHRGQEREALRVYRSALAGLDSSGRSGTMGALMTQHNTGLVLVELGEVAEAEQILHRVLLQAAAADGWDFVHFQPLIHYAETALVMDRPTPRRSTSTGS